MNKVRNANRVFNKRPLFVLAIAFALGIVLGRYFHLQSTYLILAAVLLTVAICLRKKLGFVLLCGVSVLIAAFLTASVIDIDYIDVREDMGLSGRVYAEPYETEYGSTVVLLDHAEIEGQPCGKVKLYINDESKLDIGNAIKASADVVIPKGVRNPGGFDERMYLMTQGVHYKAYADEVKIVGTQQGLRVLAAQVRAHIAATVDNIFDTDAAPIAKAMLLGDKNGLDEETYSAFKDTGMAHVLAVSGLHAGILIAFIYYVLRMLRVGRTPRLIVAIGFITVYAFVTGLTPSIVRASIMAICLLLGKHYGRQTDTLNFLSLSFILSLIINPLDMFSAGFQLSFGAVFGMLTLGWQLKYWLDRRLPETLRRGGDMLSVSAGATAGTIPILASAFNRISIFSVITNVIIIPFASVTIILVFIATLLGLIIIPLGVFAAHVAAVFIQVLSAVVDWIANFPLVAADVATLHWSLIIAFFILLLVSSKYVLVKMKVKVWLSAVLTVVVIACAVLTVRSGMYMVFLDVGQGDSAFIKTDQGGEYFIDGGRERSSREIVDFTKRNGYTPDAAFVTHTDDDHFAGIVALYEARLLKKVYCSWQEKDFVQTSMPDAEVVPLCAGDTVLLDEHTRALVLYPYKETATIKKNDSSLVLLVEYAEHSALFAGDISGNIETMLFSGLTDIDIYKAAHHGSKYSSYRLPMSVLSPQYSVVSVGYNSFGHPHEWAMNCLEEYSDEVFTTLDDYAIEFKIGDDIRVNTMKD